jgi:hypothetical protein
MHTASPRSCSRTFLIVAGLALSATAACGSDPVSYSAPVGINVKAKSGDVSGNVVTEQKDITTESGNPYGAFINDARVALSNKDPSAIEINHLTLLLGAQSTGVTTLDQVVTGDVDVAFVVNDSNNTYDAGHVMNPTGAGPVDMTVTFDSTKVAAQDWPKMMSGSFKVVLRGTAAATFAGKGAEANLQITFSFDALQ